MDNQSKKYRQNFSFFMNNKGEVLSGQKTQEELDAEAATASGQGGNNSQIDWESSDNPYRQRYENSQSQIKPLTEVLKQHLEYDHNTKTWRPKTQQKTQQEPVDFDKVFSGYDPEFSGNLKRVLAPLQQEIKTLREEKEQNAFLNNYNSIKEKAQAQVIKDFGDEFELVVNGQFNLNSPLYKVANEILRSDYAEYNADGSFRKFNRPDAEYKAVREAFGIIQKRMKADPNFGKTKLGSIQGKGTSGAGGKKVLTEEEYLKLSEDEKDAIDMAQIG